MKREKNNSAILPPDLLQIADILTAPSIKKLKILSQSQPLRVAFLNPVESLDIFFLLNYLFSLGLENLNVDYYTTDSIILKKTSMGIYEKSELEEYCKPQNLATKQNWMRSLDHEKIQIDPRLLLKIQFHWIDTSENLNKLQSEQLGCHLCIKGPVFSDTYEKVPLLTVLPCYNVELVLA